MGEQKPPGKTPLRGNPSPEMTYLPTLRAHTVEYTDTTIARI